MLPVRLQIRVSKTPESFHCKCTVNLFNFDNTLCRFWSGVFHPIRVFPTYILCLSSSVILSCLCVCCNISVSGFNIGVIVRIKLNLHSPPLIRLV